MALNLEKFLHQIEQSIKEVLVGRSDFTGSLTLTVNFLDGEAKDLIREVERQRIKVDAVCKG